MDIRLSEGPGSRPGLRKDHGTMQALWMEEQRGCVCVQSGNTTRA